MQATNKRTIVVSSEFFGVSPLLLWSLHSLCIMIITLNIIDNNTNIRDETLSESPNNCYHCYPAWPKKAGKQTKTVPAFRCINIVIYIYEVNVVWKCIWICIMMKNAAFTFVSSFLCCCFSAVRFLFPAIVVCAGSTAFSNLTLFKDLFKQQEILRHKAFQCPKMMQRNDLNKSLWKFDNGFVQALTSGEISW